MWRSSFFNDFFFVVLGGGTLWHFTEVLTVYQIYCTWIHPLLHSPLFSLPHSWNIFTSHHFSIYIQVYTVFVLYAPSHTLFPLPPASH
jgi:hypothetical protein